MHVNPDFFLFFDKGKVGLWNYFTGQNWYLEPAYLARLTAHATGAPTEISSIDDELQAAGLISKEPYDEIGWGWGKVAKIYHFATKNFEQGLPLDNEAEFVRKYIDFCAELYASVDEQDLRVRRDGRKVCLPAARKELLESVSIHAALLARKTTRTFYGTPIDLDVLATVLWYAFGEVHGSWAEDLASRGLRPLAIRKASPSGGGIHSCNAYVVALNVRDLEPGVYHYESDFHALTKVSDGDFRSMIGRLVCGQQFASKLSAGVFITSAFDKVWLKYAHSRAYRVPFIDVGHISQTFHLVANAIGLNSWLSGVFRDDEVSSLLDLSPTDPEQPIFFVGVGNGNGDYLHPELIAAIEEQQAAGLSSAES
jgi:SagB-type dehydrogenase family enzyme